MTKEKILKFLPSTYCRIKRSSIHGVGVHAIVPIQKGTNLFPDCSTNLKDIKKINKKEVDYLDDGIKEMMSDFLIESETHYFMISSLNNINISYFLNHSNHPNCIWKEEDDSFYSLEDLEVGEELTLNYDAYLVSNLVEEDSKTKVSKPELSEREKECRENNLEYPSA